MNWIRRELLKVGTGSAALHALWLPGITGCNSGKPLPKLLPSTLPLPEKYRVELPRLPALRPSSTEGDEDRYALKAIEANAKIIPRLDTPIWAFMERSLDRPSKRAAADGSPWQCALQTPNKHQQADPPKVIQANTAAIRTIVAPSWLTRGVFARVTSVDG